MTVTSTTSRVSYTGNGATTTFSVPFYFLANSHLLVQVIDTYGVVSTLVLNTNYTVTGAGVSSGGSITCTTAPAYGSTVVITRNVPATQETDYQANDPFPAATHEAALDKLTMLVQQQSNTNSRALTFPLSDAGTIDPTLPAAAARAGRYLAFDATGEPTVNGVLPAQIYLGAAASDPTTRTDGTALQTGDLYFSTSAQRMRTYSGTAWVDVGTAVPLTITVDYFSGNASTTAFTLSAAPAFQNATEVFIAGVAQKPGTDYTISSTTITFTSAPPTGTNNIMVKGLSSYAGGVPNDGSVTTAKIADAAVTGAKLSAGDGGNRIINGGFRIDQRNAAALVASPVANGTNLADRWQFVTNATTGTCSAQRVTSGPSSAILYSQNITVTAADTSVGATDYVAIGHKVEGYNIVDLIGTTFTLAFWVRSSLTGTYCVALTNSGTDRTYVATYTVNTANTWEKKSITVTGGLPTAGTWNYTTGIGLNVRWTLMAGLTQQTTAGAWQTGVGTYLATSAQVNFMGTNGNTLNLTGVQLYPGTACPPYEERPWTTEIQLCQRYYQKSYLVSIAPGTVTSGNVISAAAIASTNQPGMSRSLKVEMRATPTMTFYSYATLNAAGYVRKGNSPAADIAVTGVSVEGPGSTGFPVLASAPTANDLLYAHYTAEAEL